MHDRDCVEFLQWALPRLELRWRGYRKVRRQVCRRIDRRRRELGLPDTGAYRDYLEIKTGEWAELDRLCRVTISRFARDRGVFAAVRAEVLPALAHEAVSRSRKVLEVWSAGCASGEEPYTLALAWALETGEAFDQLDLTVLATDRDGGLLRRAQAGCYPASSLGDLPVEWVERAFEPRRDVHRLREPYRRGVTFRTHDVRTAQMQGPFDLVLCRNLAFTYFSERAQVATLEHLLHRLRPAGGLIVGIHEGLPEGSWPLEPWGSQRAIFRRVEP